MIKQEPFSLTLPLVDSVEYKGKAGTAYVIKQEKEAVFTLKKSHQVESTGRMRQENFDKARQFAAKRCCDSVKLTVNNVYNFHAILQ